MGDCIVDMIAPHFQMYTATCLWFARLFILGPELRTGFYFAKVKGIPDMAEKSAPMWKLVVEEIGLEVGKSNSAKPVAAPAECSIQKHLFYIDAGSLADHLPVLHEPRASRLAADFP